MMSVLSESQALAAITGFIAGAVLEVNSSFYGNGVRRIYECMFCNGTWDDP